MTLLRVTGLACLILATSPIAAGTPGPAAPADATILRLHVGIPGRAFIGQGREELLKQFPGAQVTPFGKDHQAFTVRLPDAGLSFVLAGPPPEGPRVASAGFNLDGVYEGMREGLYRTAEGIGKGSTVNDLLAAYGQPADIVDPSAGRGRGRSAPAPPGAPKLYQYPREDGAVTTSFVIQSDMVVRIVINDLEPLNRHILRRQSPEAPPPAGATPPDPAPEAPQEPQPPPA